MALALETQRVTVEEEFKKNPELKASDIDQLRGWLRTQPHLPEISDNKLILFHHSCNFDMTRTKETIEHHYTMRTNLPEFFTNRDITVPDLAKTLQVITYAPLPVPDSNGNCIIYFGLRDLDPNNYVPEDGVKVLFMTTDAVGIVQGTVPGYHAVVDVKGGKLRHMRKTSLSLVRKFALYGEKALPLRRKQIHVINVVPWMDRMMLLMKPWISKQTRDNFHFHGNDLESLHRHIPVECLPKELGGVLESVDVYHAANYRVLEGLREYFAEDEKLRVDDSKRVMQAGGKDHSRVRRQ